MCVTWHAVEPEFDTGAVYISRTLPKVMDLDLASIRGYTAEVCTDLFSELLPALMAGKARAAVQTGEGRLLRADAVVAQAQSGATTAAIDSIVSASYTVLLYHGVHADDLELGLRDNSGKHIPRSRFESEMRYLHDHVPVVQCAKSQRLIGVKLASLMGLLL